MHTHTGTHTVRASSDSGAYSPRRIERRWQEAWEQAGVFATPRLAPGERGTYIMPVPPFTSGGAHMGHIRCYTLIDTYARFRRACGDRVLFSLGFDSFGLPSELGAIHNNVPPGQWVLQCARRMRAQFTALGYSFDWERTFVSCEPDIYRWSQWLFLKLLERDLVYRDEARVDWCSSCNTVLARLQVEEGRCSRCGSPVRLVTRRQWFVRVSVYLDESYATLGNLRGWDRMSLGALRAALGRVEGVELQAVAPDGQTLSVFTPHPREIPEAAFVALSPRHPELDRWIPDERVEQELGDLRSGGWQRAEREADAVAVVALRRQVSIAGVPHALPVIVSPSVDARFGPTAVLGIPAREPLDSAIASRLPGGGAPSGRRSGALEEGVGGEAHAGWPQGGAAPGEPGSGASSVRLGGREAQPQRAVRYAGGDFPISRQRAWGAPIPLIHCPACGTLPVAVEDLPVRLPEDLQITGTGNPLSEHPHFTACRCPGCGGAARRETDTLDCNFDGLWLWIPQGVPREDRSRELFTHVELRSWLPVHAEVWGADGGFYLANERTLTKMLRDAGVFDYLPDGEPYVRAVMHEMVRVEGRKMSKHLGNVVDPDELVARVGADTVRLTMLHAAAPRNGIDWNEQTLEYCHRVVLRLWRFARPRLEQLELSSESAIETSDRLRRRLARGCDTAIRKVTEDLDGFQMHKAARNVIMLLSRLEEYERAVLALRGSLEAPDSEALGVALLVLVQLSAPLVPHLAEELWAAAGRERFVCGAVWPERAPSRSAVRGAAPSRADDEAARERGPLAAGS